MNETVTTTLNSNKEEIRQRLDKLKERKKIIERLQLLKNERDTLKREFSIAYYSLKPDGSYKGAHRKQNEFHRSKAQIRVISGGNRSGKSTSGINEDVAHMIGYRPWLPKDDPEYKVNIRIPNKGLICGESFGEQVRKVLIPKLLGVNEDGRNGAIPLQFLQEAKKNQQGIITFIKLTNGSQVFLQSYDQDIDLFESADYDWFHADEPPPRPIWVSIQRGLTDRVGPSWITMTPLKEPWIYDEIYNRKDVGLFYFDIEDNLNYGLTREGIDQFSSSLTPDEVEARLRGRYFHLTGLVYKSYTNIHRIKRFAISKHWPIWMHIDTHPRTPHHAIYVAIGPDQKKYICGEFKNSDPANRIAPFADALKEYEKITFGRKIDDFERLMEPGAQSPNPVKDGISIWDEFADYGFVCKPGSKNRDTGILLLQEDLKCEPDKGLYPNIFFFDDLSGIHYEITHYIWDDWAKKASQGRTDKQTPKDKDDHYIEGLHRILIAKPYFDDTNDEEDNEKELLATAANSVTGY